MRMFIDYANVYLITSNRMNQENDYRQLYFTLRTQHNLLTSELQDKLYQQNNLRKELAIMQQLATSHAQLEEHCHQLTTNNHELQAQMQQLTTTNQQLTTANHNHLQKIQDLKYSNGQLRKLNEKASSLHEKQIQMLKRQAFSPQLVLTLEDRQKKALLEKEKLQKKLDSCAAVAQEMEQYYLAEIQKQQHHIQALQQEIQQLHQQKQILQQQVQILRRNAQAQREHIARLKLQLQNASTTRHTHQTHQTHQLKNKIKFLVAKIQSMQGDKTTGNTEGKLIQSTSSQFTQSINSIQSYKGMPNIIESYKFTPSSQQGHSKWPPSSQQGNKCTSNSSGSWQQQRRNTSDMKTPNKYAQRANKNCLPLHQQRNH